MKRSTIALTLLVAGLGLLIVYQIYVERRDNITISTYSCEVGDLIFKLDVNRNAFEGDGIGYDLMYSNDKSKTALAISNRPYPQTRSFKYSISTESEEFLTVLLPNSELSDELGLEGNSTGRIYPDQGRFINFLTTLTRVSENDFGMFARELETFTSEHYRIISDCVTQNLDDLNENMWTFRDYVPRVVAQRNNIIKGVYPARGSLRLSSIAHVGGAQLSQIDQMAFGDLGGSFENEYGKVEIKGGKMIFWSSQAGYKVLGDIYSFSLSNEKQTSVDGVLLSEVLNTTNNDGITLQEYLTKGQSSLQL